MNADEIVLVEPCSASTGHVQFNRGFLSVVRHAQPSARIAFACTSAYRNEFGASADVQGTVATWIEIAAWPHGREGIRDTWNRFRWLVGLLWRMRRKAVRPTHLIFLGSSGPMLTAMELALPIMPPGCKVFAILHGNASDILYGWQPRNPLQRWFTFRSAVQRLPRSAVKIVAMEQWIDKRLREHMPNVAESIVHIPMGFDESETLPSVRCSWGPDQPVRILFLGQATPHKGFAEFVRLAELARLTLGARVEFRAAGAVRPDTRAIDQQALARRATNEPVSRNELLEELARANFVFIWQSEYYSLSPSGILLDCISLLVPMLGRKSPGVDYLETMFGPCGMFADDLDVLLKKLAEFEASPDKERLTVCWRNNLRRARVARSATDLSAICRTVLSN